MTTKLQISVGTLADMGSRFASAWNRAADGEVVDETHITFLDVQSMLTALSPRRLDLLRHVRQAIGRDYKNVHQDVETLLTAGLLIRDGRKLTAPWDELQASVSLIPA